MPTKIHNPSIEPCALPYPMRGVLKGGQAVVINVSANVVFAALGSGSNPQFPGALQVEEVLGATGPFDDFFGGFLVDPAAAPYSRQQVGPFNLVAAAAAADAAMNYGSSLSLGASFVAPRPGKITGFSAQVSVAPTVAGITIKVFKNGVLVTLAQLAFSVGGGTINYIALGANAPDFAAGDLIRVVYSAGATMGNTPTMTASIEVAM